MKIIVSGSQRWVGHQATRRLGNVLAAVMDLADQCEEELIVVHGGCPRGADLLTQVWVTHNIAEAIVFPADWSMGRGAGFARNTHMINTHYDADMMFGFLRDNSPGTTHALATARERGILTKTILWDPSWPTPEEES